MIPQSLSVRVAEGASSHIEPSIPSVVACQLTCVDVPRARRTLPVEMSWRERTLGELWTGTRVAWERFWSGVDWAKKWRDRFVTLGVIAGAMGLYTCLRLEYPEAFTATGPRRAPEIVRVEPPGRTPESPEPLPPVSAAPTPTPETPTEVITDPNDPRYLAPPVLIQIPQGAQAPTKQPQDRGRGVLTGGSFR